LETFIEAKELEDNPNFRKQKQKALLGLKDSMIDKPIIDLVNGFNKLPYCFTMQSCFGHFVFNNQSDPYNIEPLPITDDIKSVKYKIAYIAFCIENSDLGKNLFKVLNEITSLDSENIQFCSAEWFWKRQVNSYALQVEPDRFKLKDTAMLDYNEALHIEKIRNEFFAKLEELLRKQSDHQDSIKKPS
jgi:hypothetical protein